MVDFVYLFLSVETMTEVVDCDDELSFATSFFGETHAGCYLGGSGILSGP